MDANLLFGLSVLALAIWIGLAFFRANFWRADQRLPTNAETLLSWPSVSALVPARNEEDGIGPCLKGLAAQDYPGEFQIVVVNDASTDDTAKIARSVAEMAAVRRSIKILDAPPLQPGWAGKLWALQHGAQQISAEPDPPRFLWLTDADIVHDPGVLKTLVAKAQKEDRAIVSLMVKLSCKTFWEHLLVPAFVFFFQQLYPFPAVNDRKSKVAGAAGGCLLIDRQILNRQGGFAAIREALIDDCALARLIKQAGHPIWLGLGEHSLSLRSYGELGEFWRMVTRSAFVQLNFSFWALVGTIVGMTLTYLAAPIILLTFPVHRDFGAAVLALGATALMIVLYLPTIRYYGLLRVYALTLPLAAVLFTAMTIHSALMHWFGGGSSWKNRNYREGVNPN